MNHKPFQLDASVPYLVKGIGLAIVLVGTLIGVIHAKTDSRQPQPAAPPSANSPSQRTSTEPGQEESLAALTREVARLRIKLEQETTVDEVLVNPWFEALSLFGSAVFASSFFLEWHIKRSSQR